jgi:hypothetical protein
VKADELESKYKAYQAMTSDAPDAIRKDKESELAVAGLWGEAFWLLMFSFLLYQDKRN